MRAAAAARAPDRREPILQAAFTRFAHYGYRRTSLEDVAREAGISRAAVYLHFRNKEDVFRALARELQEAALRAATAAARGSGPIDARLVAILEAKLASFFDVAHRSPHARELLDENSRICADISADARRRYLRLLRGLLDAAIARGELRPATGLGAGAAAELIVDCAKGLEGAGALTPALYRRRLAQLVRVLVRGLGGHPAR